MPTLKAIRRRIASVKSTQQITRAMKLVAAARLRRAQEALFNARPYSESLARVADSVLAAERASLAPAEDAKNAALIVVVSSDRGQCGSYNANLLKLAEEAARQARSAGLEPRFFAIGRKSLDHFNRTGAVVAGERTNNPHLATVGLARDVAAEMLSAYRSGEVRETSLIYMQFRSALSQRPTYERLLPVAEPGGHPAGEGVPAHEAHAADIETEGAAEMIDYLIEPSRERLVPLVLRASVEAAVFHALLEAEASEQGARMTAMDSATNNASDMIERLTLEMNRARQAQITRELMDIVGGAEALRG
jgi:F-type H+-transporting ATPase subunit gamma